ncbi:uroporphyrinogen-III C-methyltransferase [Rhizomicrobium electricum]|uniref:uroporphyrinogen-III C-methyltransferase n=1 Tax=Rhizomicrobium electricum TaxID=480070 RepID=A0ABN1F9T0_9PROT|nr:uroporphyrinogen-III C-methyltransferase [Rhizomicrobium electricum]NIJ50625.1 uroporphyrin-III C-methyltransferase [Rhizomicrobium electricum]
MTSDLTNAAERAAIEKLAAALGLPAFEPGWVWLAGAGPGDPGLITALGLHAVSAADVILYDALANEDLLKLARPGAELVFAGKRAGMRSCKQTEISRTLVALAHKHKRVLRLKGGDPLVFGRGAEEALDLAAAGVPFRIVPGVTAGIGGLAYAGIPLTHRDTGHAVTFLTGHGADGKLPEFDWNAIAHGSPTLVLYMATKHAGVIAEKLIAAGRNADEPAAVVSRASLPDQSVQTTTLGRLGEVTAVMPAILVIGKNVDLRDGMNWLAGIPSPPQPIPLDRAG